MDEIIIRKTGNTYVGEIAHKATATPLPAILKLDASEHYHVFEWQFNCWILRASQSTKNGALGYDGSNRVLVYREK